MNQETQYQIFSLELKGYKGIDIAKKLNISKSTVSKTLKKISGTREYELGVISVNTFLDIFKKAEQFWNQSQGLVSPGLSFDQSLLFYLIALLILFFAG